MEEGYSYDFVGKKEVAAYSMVSFGYNLLGITLSTFLLYYYTDIRMMPAAWAGVILFVVRICDGVMDPVISYRMDSRHTGKEGYYRHFIIRGAVPLGVLFVLMFLPFPVSQKTDVVICFLIYLLWTVFYSIVQAGSLPLLVTMSRNREERVSINTAKVAAAIVATLLVRYYVLKLVVWIGNGSELAGFTRAAVLLAVVAVACLLPGALHIRERNPGKASQLSLWRTIRVLAGSPGLVAVFLMYLVSQLGSNIKGQAAMYYLIYFMNREDFVPTFLVLNVISSLCMQPVIIWVARRLQAGWLVTGGYLFAALAMLAMGAAGDSLPGLVLANVAYGIATAFPTNLVFVFAAEHADRIAKTQGITLHSMASSLLGLASRIGFSIAGAVVAFVLSVTNYRPNQIQSGPALRGIGVCFVLLPMAAYLLAGIISLFALKGSSRTAESG